MLEIQFRFSIRLKPRTHDKHVGQHLFANVGKQKFVVCSKSWPTFFVGQQAANGAL